MYAFQLLFPLLILIEIMNYTRSCYVVEIIDFIGLFEAFYNGICGGDGFHAFLCLLSLKFDISSFCNWILVIFALNGR